MLNEVNKWRKEDRELQSLLDKENFSDKVIDEINNITGFRKDIVKEHYKKVTSSVGKSTTFDEFYIKIIDSIHEQYNPNYNEEESKLNNSEDRTKVIRNIKIRPQESKTSQFIDVMRMLSLPKALRATYLIIDELDPKFEFARYSKDNYYTHPIEVAQEALDYNIISKLISEGKTDVADDILTTCLLCDVQDVNDHLTTDVLTDMFGESIVRDVDSLNRYSHECFEVYIKRLVSSPISSLVRILNALETISGLSKHPLDYRKEKIAELKEVDLPLTEVLKDKYWSYGNFYLQANKFLTSLINEIELAIKFEEDIIHYRGIIEENEQ